jgi:hypothetical protein
VLSAEVRQTIRRMTGEASADLKCPPV